MKIASSSSSHTHTHTNIAAHFGTGWVRKETFSLFCPDSSLPRLVEGGGEERRAGNHRPKPTHAHKHASDGTALSGFCCQEIFPNGMGEKSLTYSCPRFLFPRNYEMQRGVVVFLPKRFQHQWKMRGKVQGFPSPLHHWAEKSRRHRSNPPRFPPTLGRLLCGAREE